MANRSVAAAARSDDPGRSDLRLRGGEVHYMSRRDWLVSIIGWDAGLPLAVAASFFVLPELVAVLFVPIAAAIFRAHHGHQQFVRRGIRATLGRQFLFACSLVTLMLFEALLGMLHFARGATPYAWLAAGALYLVYLSLVAFALRPPRSAPA